MKHVGWIIALLALMGGCKGTKKSLAVAPPPHGLAFTTYHFDTGRGGWSDAESTLTPARVKAGLSVAWSTSLDDATVSYTDDKGGPQTQTFPARVFATPLYLDDVALGAGPLAGTSS